MLSDRICLVVMYHYVRDLPFTDFPRIRGLLTSNFQRQVEFLESVYEMASLETTIAFWQGKYASSRDICLLTFDDGLKDHYTDVLPILVKRKIQGLFFLITESIEDNKVVDAHKNHFLMASLGFEAYKDVFLKYMSENYPDEDTFVDEQRARNTYRWDNLEVASFKYLLNSHISAQVRAQVVGALFLKHLGDEFEFSRQLYLSWDEAIEMQRAGMVMGGHSHNHIKLTNLLQSEQQEDLRICANILKQHLDEQTDWPFSYPYGKADTFDSHTVKLLKQNGFACSFCTIPGKTQAGDDLYTLRRTDTKSIENA